MGTQDWTDEGLPVSDTGAIARGFTRAIVAECDEYTLYLLVKPDVDLDSRFKAWNRDEGQWLEVSGWLFVSENESKEN